MLGRRKKRAIDVNRLASTALEAFLEPEGQSKNGHAPEKKPGGHRLGTASAVALGVAAAAAGRAVYHRAREFDLAEAAERVEDRLSR